jgi:cation:H+ antiporter
MLVRGASKLALSFGISPLVVGLTIVAFGTSAPEVAVSWAPCSTARPTSPSATWWAATSSMCCSSWASAPDHAAGGQHPADPAGGADHDRRGLLLLALALDGRLGLGRWLLLLALLVAYTVFLVVQSRRETPGARTSSPRDPSRSRGRRLGQPLPAQIALIVAGLALLVFGSDYLVQASVTLPRRWA